MAGTEPISRKSAITIAEFLGIAAVTTVVAALGYSVYRTHAVHKQVTAGLTAARVLTPIVVHAFRRTREAPPDESAATAVELARAASPFVGSISLDNGRIDVVFDGDADAAIAGRHLSLVPYETASLEIVWLCGNTPPGPGLKPLGFAAGGRQAAQLPTTIEERFLPPDCR